MPGDLHLPLLAAVALVWYLVCALRQTRAERAASPNVVWREATDAGWSDWTDLPGLSGSSSYDVMLAAVRMGATADATAVQFAVVVQPDGAPDFTLRVLFMSEVRERAVGRPTALTARAG